jgi:hypothetical protein
MADPGKTAVAWSRVSNRRRFSLTSMTQDRDLHAGDNQEV